MASNKRCASDVLGKQPKKMRKSLALDVKLDILRRHDDGQRTGEISKVLNLANSTVSTVLKNKDAIRNAAENVSDISAKRITKTRDNVMEETERLLTLWVNDINRRSGSLAVSAVQEKALSLFEDCKKRLGGPDYNVSFTASHGWYERFKIRANIKQVKKQGEAASADVKAAENYVEALKEKITAGGYSAKQVLNMDETGLFWKKMSNKTFISRDEKSAPGFKAAKDRITVLLAGNAEGDLKLKPLVVYHSENPRALKGFVKEQLRVIWRSNSKGWLTSSICHNYMVNHLSPSLERYARRNNIPNRFLLLLDNAPSHPKNMDDWCDNVEVMFLPPNTTSLIQPMDQGVIANFKALYQRKTMRKLISFLDNHAEATVKEFWKAFNIKDALDYMVEAWDEVSTSCMNGVWRKVWPECVHDFTGFPSVSDIRKDIVQLSHEAGFEDVDDEDVAELLASHEEPLTNEELTMLEQERAYEKNEEEENPTPKVLDMKSLVTILAKFDDAIECMKELDPNASRSYHVASSISNALKGYNELLQEKKRRAKQPKIHSFFRRSTSCDATPSTSRSSTPAISPIPIELPSPSVDDIDDSAADSDVDNPLPLDCLSNDEQQ